MNRKVKSIAAAAVAMGYGKLSDYHGNSISEVLAEFAAIANSAAKLPAATAADAGKVPTVDENGSYKLAEAGGGGLVVEMPGAIALPNKEVGDYITFNYSEPVEPIASLMREGTTTVFVKFRIPSGTAFYVQITSASENSISGYVKSDSNEYQLTTPKVSNRQYWMLKRIS